MQKLPFDYAVFIGKFSPIHDGHVATIRHALLKAEKVIMVLGQCYEARNTRLPFTEDERAHMIRLATNNDPRVLIAESENFLYNDERWMASVHEAVYSTIQEDDGAENSKIALAGMAKDSTSYYLNIFPQFRYDIPCEPHFVDSNGRQVVLSSTLIRKRVFENEVGYLRPYIDEKVANFISDRVTGDLSEDWKRLFHDFKYEQNYPVIYGKGPHLTVDSVVTQAGHILLIKRGKEYGKGLLAMPGGFLNPEETLMNGRLRELAEETVLKVPVKVLKGSVAKIERYDDPFRSNRARIVTEAAHFDLAPDGKNLPKVKGSDDAMHAEWYPIADVMQKKDQWFEDHWHIVSDMLGI